MGERMRVYLGILLVSAVFMGYVVRDGRWWFFDDFAAIRYVSGWGVGEIVANSFRVRDVDYHKFLGYVVIRKMYEQFGVEYFPYLFLNFVVHTANSILVYEIVRRVVGRVGWVAAGLSGVFLLKMWLSWPSNLHDMMAGFFYFWAILMWIEMQRSRGLWKELWYGGVMMVYLAAIGSKATGITLPVGLGVVWLVIGERGRWKEIVVRLIPMVLVMAGYVVYFGSHLREVTSGTGYVSSYTVRTYLVSQREFWQAMSRFLPGWSWLVAMGVVWVWGWRLGVVGWWGLWLGYAVAVAPMSFFLVHASPYYIYIPVVFVLMAVGRWLERVSGGWRRGVVSVVMVVVVFDPLAQLRKMVVKYRHPDLVGFDRVNAAKLAEEARRVVDEEGSEFYFSDWEMSANLYSLVYHDALGLWMGGGKYDEYRYGYDRARERVVVARRGK